MPIAIHAATVCVNYGDLLAITHPLCSNHLASRIIITSPEDYETQDTAHSLGLEVLLSDEYKPVFNKSKMLNHVLYRLYERYPNDWYLNLDADTYFRFYIEPQLVSHQLYGAVRKIFGSFDDWKANKYIVDTHETKHARMGYFQLFNKSNIFYNETYNTAGYSDSEFADRYFTSLVTFPTQVCEAFHLGNKDKNWEGRTTERW